MNIARVRKFFSFYGPYKRLFAADVGCAVAVSAASLIIPLLARRITGEAMLISGGDATRGILTTGAFMLALIALQTGCGLFYDHMGHVMGARMERDMRLELFSHMQRLPFSFFDANRTGSLMSRVTNDLLNLTELYHHGPEDLVIYLTTFTGALVILMRLNASLALAVCAFLPIMVIYSLFFQKRLRAAYKISRERIADVNAQLEDSLSGVRVVKSFAGEDAETAKFGEANERFCRSRADIYRHEAYYYTGLTMFFAQLVTGGAAVFGALWVSRASLALPDLVAFLLYAGYLTAPIPKIAHVLQQYQDGISGFNRFMDVMETPAERDTGTADLRGAKGRVTLDDVSFAYAEGREFVLKHLSLDVCPGETVALVGPSGVGKTTLCSLIPRFYDVTGGAVLIDGQDVRGVSLKSLRENIGVVQQDVYLFAGTVLDNIRYGRPDASMDEVVAAAKRANAHEFISALPGGYHADIGQRGVRLSGGQRQRLSIARVFLKNPRILIFDEATSSLDNQSERVVHEALYELAPGRTTFVIAHRLSTVRRASRILVLTENGLEEQGAHDELLAKDGVYAGLYKLMA